METTIDLAGPSDYGYDPTLNAERTVNMYMHNNPSNNRPCLLGFDGLTYSQIKGVTDQPTRKLYVPTVRGLENQFMIHVYGNSVAHVQGSTSSPIGNINSTVGYIGITANNNDEVAIVDGVNLYVYDVASGSFDKIDDPVVPDKPIDATFLDGYIIIANANDNKFAISALNDAKTWNAFDFAQFDSRPDRLTACRVVENSLFLFGANYTDVWFNTGASNFPFRKNKSYGLESGCASEDSIVEFVNHRTEKGNLVWLATDKHGINTVLITEGINATSLSTPSVNNIINRYSNVSNAVGIVYEENGHTFYELSFDEGTWVCDLTLSNPETGKSIWTEKSDERGRRHIANYHAFYNRFNYFGDYRNSNIYYLDPDSFKYDDKPIKRQRISKLFKDEKSRKICIGRIEIVFKVGIGEEATSENIENPPVLLSLSKNKGETFGNNVIGRLGRAGEFIHRVQWWNLGTADSFIFKLEYYSEKKFIIMEAIIDYDVLE